MCSEKCLGGACIHCGSTPCECDEEINKKICKVEFSKEIKTSSDYYILVDEINSQLEKISSNARVQLVNTIK